MEIKSRSEFWKLLPENAVIAEVGCARGENVADMANWSNVSKVYAIDNWDTIEGQKGDGGYEQDFHDYNYKVAMSNFEPFTHKIVVLKGMSVSMSNNISDESLDFCYLDGDHSYSGVIKDIEAYWRKLKVGGIMGFHDIKNRNDYGVGQAVDELCTLYGIELHDVPENSHWDASGWVRKTF